MANEKQLWIKQFDKTGSFAFVYLKDGNERNYSKQPERKEISSHFFLDVYLYMRERIYEVYVDYIK